MEQLKLRAKELLEKGDVKVIIGYQEDLALQITKPIFVTDHNDVEKLVWNANCIYNLAVYLTKPEIKKLGKPAIVAKGCDIKAIITLIQEFQIKRNELVILAMVCNGMEDNEIADKKACALCKVKTPSEYDELFGEKTTNQNPTFEDKYAILAELEGKNQREKWQFWKKELTKCTRCYACRQVCSLCYCNRCIADKSMPQWIDTSAHFRGNLSWNLIRAYHLAGRCIGCGECERVCPVNIPLMLLNKSMAKIVEKEFNYISGADKNAAPFFVTFTPDDKEDIFL